MGRTGYRKIIRSMVLNSFIWKGISISNKIVHRFVFEKELIELEKKAQLMEKKETRLKEIFKDLIVKHGFFKGMKYPELLAHGSSIYPKLLGSYESELTLLIEQIVKDKDYTEIIDVGCAEGFYAVGLAIRMPHIKVYAFDIDTEAVKSCKKMAELNNVGSNIQYGNHCSSETLKDFNFTKKGLIVSDCEGYEIELFTKENIQNLLNCDVLIELHDAKNERVSPYIFALFEQSHNKRIVQSVNCFSKASEYTELTNLSMDELEICLQERNGIQQWVFFTTKNNRNDK